MSSTNRFWAAATEPCGPRTAQRDRSVGPVKRGGTLLRATENPLQGCFWSTAEFMLRVV